MRLARWRMMSREASSAQWASSTITTAGRWEKRISRMSPSMTASPVSPRTPPMAPPSSRAMSRNGPNVRGVKRSSQVPSSTLALSATRPANACSSQVFPIPASPATSTVVPRPVRPAPTPPRAPQAAPPAPAASSSTRRPGRPGCEARSHTGTMPAWNGAVKPYVRRQARVVAAWTRSPSRSTSLTCSAAPSTPRRWPGPRRRRRPLRRSQDPDRIFLVTCALARQVGLVG